MPIPYRDWKVFESAHVHGISDGAGSYNTIAEYTAENFNYMKTGEFWGALPPPRERRQCFTRPTDATFELKTSLDEILDIGVSTIVTEDGNTQPQIEATLYFGWLNQAVGEWAAGLVTGKTYDGVNPWDGFARTTISIGDVENINPVITLANTPQRVQQWFTSRHGAVLLANQKQAKFFRNGLGFYIGNFDPGLNDGESCYVRIQPTLIRVRYFNAVVNSISTTYAPTAAGTEIVLTGLCFNPSADDLNAHATTPLSQAAWDAEMWRVYFEGNEGQGDYTMLLGAGVGKFVIDSDTQITITLPAMVAGTYTIKLRKFGAAGIAGTGLTVDSYAGDFSCDEDGLIRDDPGGGLPGLGPGFAFIVSDSYVPPDEIGPLLLTDWRWKNKAGDLALRSWSPIDAPSPDVFYDGRLMGISSLKREVDDNTGAFSISDMTVNIANHDKEISKLLAEYFLKNQIVDIYQHFASRPFAERIAIHKCIVDDYSLEGTNFPVVLKDITRKYFGVKVPRYRCTEEEFGDIHDSAKGRVMPEILGLCSVTDVTTPGAVEAVYIDTVNFIYLAARGSLYAVDEVYSDKTEMAEGADYAIVYADGGRTYIDFVNDQGDNKITFNCKGYHYDVLYDWNSANGYIQNPIYIQLFLLAFIAEIPDELINIASFDTLAALFVTNEWDESGHFILQDETDLDEALKGLLFTCGNYGFIAIDGRFKVVKKSIEDFVDTTIRIFDQIDLMRPAKRNYNLRSAVNYIQSLYDFYPAPNQYYGSLEDKRDSSIEDYEAEIEPNSRMAFPWTNSLTLIQDRLTEILLKRGYGDNRISFSLSIKWFKRIDLLTNFRFQDPYGLSSTGAGEEGRYYYIISLSYNWIAATIDVEAVDLQWLLRQYFIFGDGDDIADNWDDATESERIWGYMCDNDTGEFDDGEPGKAL